jgi:hypothetical protein
MKSALPVIVTAALLLTAAPPRATAGHHGGAAYDQTKMVVVQATMIEMQYKNPHVLLFFEVANDKGEKEKWSGWLTAPTKLSRAGWTKNTLGPGDKVEISGRPHRGGERVLQIRKLVVAGGKELPLFED